MQENQYLCAKKTMETNCINISITCYVSVDTHSFDTMMHRKKQEPEKDSRPFEDAAYEAIEKLSKKRKPKTIENHKTALRSFLRFRHDLRVCDIDRNTIEAYEYWLANKEHELCPNTSSAYMRSLRVQLEHINPDADYKAMFKKVFTGNEKTRKRALTQENVHKVITAKTVLEQHPSLLFWHEVFIFQVLAQGMPFVDLAFLKKSQVKDGHIEYRRSKSRQPVCVKLMQPMQDIISRYSTKDSPYLLPILTTTNPTEAYCQYRSKLSVYNQALKRIAKMTGINNLSSYMPRHTWASIAYALNITLAAITKCMGHTNSNTTQIYLSEINNTRSDEACQLVADELFKGVRMVYPTPAPPLRGEGSCCACQ